MRKCFTTMRFYGNKDSLEKLAENYIIPYKTSKCYAKDFKYKVFPCDINKLKERANNTPGMLTADDIIFSVSNSNLYYIELDAECDLSVESNALKTVNKNYISLLDITKEYSLTLEYYSEEINSGFNTHSIIHNGESIEFEKIPYREFYIDSYSKSENPFEEFCTTEKLDSNATNEIDELFGITVENLREAFEQAISDPDVSWIRFGGYPEWCFDDEYHKELLGI